MLQLLGMPAGHFARNCIAALLAIPMTLGAASGLAAPTRAECQSPPAGTVFCEDFEGTNPKANFNDYDGNPDSENQVVGDSGPSASSTNKVLKLRVPAGQRGGGDLVKVLGSTYDRLYARWYFKYEAGFDFSALNHGGGLAAGSRDFIGHSGDRPSGADFAGFYLQYQENTRVPYAYSYYRGMYQDCADPNGSCWGDSLPCVFDTGTNYCKKAQHRPAAALPRLEADRWYCVEEMVDMGTPTSAATGANGRLAMWLDDQQFADFGDLWIRTTSSLKLQSFWISLFHHDGNHSTAGQLVDNVVVSTQKVGCGTGSPDVLAPPKNFRVIQ